MERVAHDGRDNTYLCDGQHVFGLIRVLDEKTRMCVIGGMNEGEKIKQARLARNWSQARLAFEAKRFVMPLSVVTVTQQVVDRIEKGGNSKYKNAVLRALDLPLVTDGGFTTHPPATTRPVPPELSSVAEDLDAPSYKSLAGRLRDVDELGIAVGGKDGEFELNGMPVATRPRPPSLIGRDVFAVRVKNDSMDPRFRDGDLLYVERHQEPAVGEDVIVELHPEIPDSAGHAFIKTLVSKNSHTVIVKQYNPKEEITFNRRDIKKLYRVIPNNEVFGV